MARLPTAQENAGLDAILVTSTTYYLSLHTGDPGTTGATEVTGGSYIRQSIAFAAAASGSKASNTAQNFTAMPVEAGAVGYFGIWTASTSGTYLGGGTLTGVASVPAGATVAVASGGITATLS